MIENTYTTNEGVVLTMREVTTEEVCDAAACYENGTRMSYELAKLCLVRVNGVVVTAQNRDEVWAGLNHRTRQLALRAYIDMNGVSKETEDAFLKTRQTTMIAA